MYTYLLKISCFEFFVTNLCNLNCLGCSRFCNKTTKETLFNYPIDQFKKDLENLNKLNHSIPSLTLSGGEVFLHPNLEELLKLANTIFPNSSKWVFTNFKAVNVEKAKLLKKYNFSIVYTRYPQINYDKLEEIEKIVPCVQFSSPKLIFTNQQLLETNDNNPKQYYRCENVCTIITPNKIWKCTRLCNLDSYNKLFNKHFNTLENVDYLSIDKINDFQSINDFMHKPSSLCSKCGKKCGFKHQIDTDKSFNEFELSKI